MRRTLALLAAIVVLGSCATLSEEECVAGDWAAIGRADGAEGRGFERLEAHRRACARAGVTPDATAWEQGRQRGLRLYCTPAKAYQVGRSGRSIAPGCVQAELAGMSPAFERGRNYFRIAEDIRRIESDAEDLARAAAALAADDPRRGAILARRSMLRSRITLLRLELRRYDSWP